MPRYQNTGTNNIGLEGYFFTPGQIRNTYRYLTHPDLTLISHDPRVRPLVTLNAGAIPGTQLTNLQRFVQLIVYNATGGDVTLTFNGDTGNTHVIPDLVESSFDDLDGIVDTLDCAGAGAGDLYIYGVPKQFPKAVK